MLGRGEGREHLEEVREVTARFDVIRLCGFDQAIEARTGSSTGDAVREQPVLTAYDQGTDRVPS